MRAYLYAVFFMCVCLFFVHVCVYACDYGFVLYICVLVRFILFLCACLSILAFHCSLASVSVFKTVWVSECVCS